LHFWSFPSIMFKIKLTGTVWYVQKRIRCLSAS